MKKSSLVARHLSTPFLSLPSLPSRLPNLHTRKTAAAESSPHEPSASAAAAAAATASTAATSGPDYSWTSSTKRSLALELVRVTEAAALAGARFLGRGDKEAADGAAVDIMRRVLNTIPMDGIVVIGEGEFFFSF